MLHTNLNQIGMQKRWVERIILHLVHGNMISVRIIFAFTKICTKRRPRSAASAAASATAAPQILAPVAAAPKEVVLHNTDSPRVEAAWLYLIITVTLLLFGSGTVSVDQLFRLGQSGPKKRR